MFTRIGVQFCHTILIIMGFIAELLRHYRLIGTKRAQEREEQTVRKIWNSRVNQHVKDFPPLCNHFQAMYSNNIYRMASDVLGRPLCCVPATKIVVQERDFNAEWTLESTGNATEVLNLG